MPGTDEIRMLSPTGVCRSGFSIAEFVGKLEKLATKVLPRTQVEELRDAMLKLEKVSDTMRIERLLAIQ